MGYFSLEEISRGTILFLLLYYIKLLYCIYPVFQEELKMTANLDCAQLRGGIEKRGCGKIASHCRRMVRSRMLFDRKYSAHTECCSEGAKGCVNKYTVLDFHFRNSNGELCKRDTDK